MNSRLVLHGIPKSCHSEAECPRFASVLWTLTWAQQHPRRSAAGLAFPVDRGSLRSDLYRSYLPQRVVTKTAPLPVGRGIQQSAGHGGCDADRRSLTVNSRA